MAFINGIAAHRVQFSSTWIEKVSAYQEMVAVLLKSRSDSCVVYIQKLKSIDTSLFQALAMRGHGWLSDLEHSRVK